MSEVPRRILLCPGPVTVSDRVRKALTRGDWSHREPEFAELTRAINNHLLRVYREVPRDFQSVILTGSGTCAVEAMLATFTPRTGRTLVLVNGACGERLVRMLEVHGRPHLVVRSDWGQPLDLAATRVLLNAHTDVSHVVTVHHETATGRLNDLSELGKLCVDRRIQLLLDCVSSFGAEAIDVDGWNVAALAATASKCLQGVPGIAFVMARKHVWASAPAPADSVYLDLAAYYQNQHGSGFSPFTQAVQPAFALLAALEELEANGGWQQRRSIYRVRAGRIAVTLRALGLQTVLPPQDYSCAMWSWRVPEGDRFERIHAVLKKRGFIVSGAADESAPPLFRLAHMGDIQESDLQRLEQALRHCFAHD